MRKAGNSVLAVGQKFGLSRSGMKLALERYERQLGHGPAEPPLPPPVDDSEAEDEVELPEALTPEEQKQWLTGLIRKTQKRAEALLEVSPDESRRMLELAFKASNTLARITKEDQSDDYRLNKDDVAEIKASALKKVMDYLATKRPLLCLGCSRALSVRWGKGEGAPEVEEKTAHEQ